MGGGNNFWQRVYYRFLLRGEGRGRKNFEGVYESLAEKTKGGRKIRR